MTWSSGKTAIATVNETTGVVTGVAKGQAVVTATSTANAMITATCAVTVTEPAPKGMEIGDFYMSDGTMISKDATLTAEQKAQCVGIVQQFLLGF